MGESQNQPLQISFNKFLRVDFQGTRVTSDGGLLLVRELDERLGLTRIEGARGEVGHPAPREGRQAGGELDPSFLSSVLGE